LLQSRVDLFPLNPSYATCSVSVYAEIGVAKKPLHCPIDLIGIDPDTTICINRSPPPSSSMRDSTSSSSSTASISQTRRETEEGTFRSDIAYRVMTECTGTIKERLDLSTCSLVDRLLEKRIINEKQKTQITDQHCGLTADQRMDKLLSLVKASIEVDSQINLPVNVTRRYWHSLSVWSVTPTTNWIIEFGGAGTSYTDTAVIEVRYTSDNDWSNSLIPLDQYQDQLRRRILSDWENLGLSKEVQLLRGHLQQREREFYVEQLQREIKEKEQMQQDRDKEQQQLLQEKARLSQQLDDATTLLEQAEKYKSFLELEYYEMLKAKVAEILEEKTQVEEKKKIITEDYEKLKLKVAELLEEKEEQYLKEKQIIIDDNQNLISEKDKVIAKLTSNEKQIIIDLKEKELYIAKLVKERQERVLKQPIKETSSIGLQFNYLIPSMDKLDCLSDVQVAERKLFLIQGDKPQLMNWEKYGLRIG
uniref:Uncharacterized protein n=1 Tax=Amphimedon queenslandica TaxID=400682 RepID=A0A1X7T697_AMPQE